MLHHQGLDVDCDNDPTPQNIPDIVPANNAHDQRWGWVWTYNRAARAA